MKTLALAFALITTGAFATDTASVGSCTLNTEGTRTCIDYTGTAWGQAREAVQQSCEQEGGTFSSDSCSKENNIGACLMNEDQPVEFAINFYQPTELDEAQAACAVSGGRWE